MTQAQTKQYNDDVILHIIVILTILATLFLQFISLPWPSNQSNTKSPQSLDTPHSPTMKDKSLPTPHSASTSLKTEEVGRTSTGKVSGTPSPRSKKLKSGSSTQSASRRTRTRSNPTTPTVGSQSLA
jgi:cytoskeletal protein RodZ